MKLFAWFYPQHGRLNDEAYVTDALNRCRRLRLDGLYFMPEESAVLETPQLVRGFLQRCADQGLECQLGFLPFSEPKAPTPEMLRRRYLYHEDGAVRRHGLCPAWHENRLLALQRAEQLCAAVNPSALHLDYLRYYFANSKAFGVNLEWEEGGKWIATYHRCDCPLCQTDRLDLLGREATAWDEHHPAYLFKTLQRRRDHIDEVVQAMRQLCSQRGMKLSVAVRVQYFNRALIEGQDWPRWCKEQWLDTISPMNYSPHVETVRRRLEENMRLLQHTRTEVIEGLSRRSSAGETAPEDLLNQIHAARDAGAAGAAIFHLDALTERDYELLGAR